jgi:adenylate cyclase
LPAAADAVRRSIAALNQRRSAEGLPTTEMCLGLHIGEVFFCNVGSRDRLDFTVVGPAAMRSAASLRCADQPLLSSAPLSVRVCRNVRFDRELWRMVK